MKNSKRLFTDVAGACVAIYRNLAPSILKSRVRSAQLSLANAAETITNLLGVANDFDSSTRDEWLQLTPLGDFPHARGIQRVDKKAVTAMANHFSSLRAKLSRRFGGLPFFVGHPDVPGLANEYPDQKAYGWIMEVEAREDGLWGKPKWSEAGRQMLANAHYKFFSPHWNAEEAREDGKRILRPVQLVSVGLTNKPNLPVNPLANEGKSSTETEKRDTENTENFMSKEQLIKLFGLANDATDEQIQSKVTAAAAAITAVANAQAEKATAETALTNTKSTLTTAEGLLETTRTALANERKERITLLVANAIRDGKITEAQKAQWVADLTADFDGKVTALANAKVTVNTDSKTAGMGNRRLNGEALANVQERREKLNGLVNEKMKAGLSYDEAFATVKREQPALFDQMAKPHSNEGEGN